MSYHRPQARNCPLPRARNLGENGPELRTVGNRDQEGHDSEEPQPDLGAKAWRWVGFAALDLEWCGKLRQGRRDWKGHQDVLGNVGEIWE